MRVQNFKGLHKPCLQGPCLLWEERPWEWEWSLHSLYHSEGSRLLQAEDEPAKGWDKAV